MCSDLNTGMSCAGCNTNYFCALAFTREQIVDFLKAHSVLKRHSTCKRCAAVLPLNCQMLFRCYRNISVGKKKKKPCGWKKSGRVGSFLDRTHLDIVSVWRVVVYFLFHGPPRQSFLQLNLHLSTHSVADWESVIQEVFDSTLRRTSVKLGGQGRMVAIDEGMSGKRKKQGTCYQGSVGGGWYRRDHWGHVPCSSRSEEPADTNCGCTAMDPAGDHCYNRQLGYIPDFGRLRFPPFDSQPLEKLCVPQQRCTHKYN